MALSDNGEFLYIGFNGSNVFRRFNLASHAVDLEVSLGNHSYYTWLQYKVTDLAALPGNPHSVAVAEIAYTQGPQVLIFDEGVQRSNALPVGGAVEPASATELFAGPPFTRFNVNASGVTGYAAYDGLQGFYEDIKYQGGFIFTSGGRIFDPETTNVLGYLPPCSIVEPYLSVGRVFTLASQPVFAQPPAWTLYACDPISLQAVANLPIPGVLGGPISLIRWGTNGLAFCTSQNQVFLVRTSLIATGPPADLAITVSDNPHPAVLNSNLTYSIQVTNSGPNDAQGVTLLDAVPSRVAFVSASSTLGACTWTNGVVTCDLGTLSNALVQLSLSSSRQPLLDFLPTLRF